MDDDFDGKMLDELAAPDVLGQHPDMRAFQGDKSIRAYATDAGQVYEDTVREKMPQLVDKLPELRAGFEEQARKRAQAHIIEGMADKYKSEGSTGKYVAERLPLVGMNMAAEPVKTEIAEKRIKAGDADAEHYFRVAESIAEQQREHEKGWIRKTADIATQVPRAIAEFGLAAAPAEGADLAVRGLVGTGLLGKAAGMAAGGAALGATALAPDAIGRAAKDVVGGESATTAIPRAAISALVEGTIFHGTGVFTAQEGKSLLAKALYGLGAVQGDKELQRDLGLKPGEGVGKTLLTGTNEERVEALKEFATDAVVMGGLAGLTHLFERNPRIDRETMGKAFQREAFLEWKQRRETADAAFSPNTPNEPGFKYGEQAPAWKSAFADAYNFGRENRYSEDGIRDKFRDIKTKIDEALKRNPNATNAELRAEFDDFVDNPFKDFAHAWVDAVVKPEGASNAETTRTPPKSGEPAPADAEGQSAEVPRLSEDEAARGPKDAESKPALVEKSGGEVSGDEGAEAEAPAVPRLGVTAAEQPESGGVPELPGGSPAEAAGGGKAPEARTVSPKARRIADAVGAATYWMDTPQQEAIINFAKEMHGEPEDVVRAEFVRRGLGTGDGEHSVSLSERHFLAKEISADGNAVAARIRKNMEAEKAKNAKAPEGGAVPAAAAVKPPAGGTLAERMRAKQANMGVTAKAQKPMTPGTAPKPSKSALEVVFEALNVTPREREVVLSRLGKTQEEIGEEQGVTKQRIQQIEKAAFGKLGIEQGSVKTLVHDPTKAGRAADQRDLIGKAARGEPIAVADLSDIDEDAVKGHHGKYHKLQTALEETQDQIVKALENGESTTELESQAQKLVGDLAALDSPVQRSESKPPGVAGKKATAKQAKLLEEAKEVEARAFGRPKGRSGAVNMQPFIDAARAWERMLAEPPPRTQARGILRHENASRVRRADRDANILHSAEQRYYRIEAMKGTARTQEFLRIMDALEGRGTLTGADKAFQDSYRRLHDEYTQALIAETILSQALQDHVMHQWRDPNNPNATADDLWKKLLAKKPLSGAEGFRKMRTKPTYRDGIAAGLEPVSWNPATLAKLEFDQYSKSLFGRRAFFEMKKMGLAVTQYQAHPSDWVRPQIEDKLWDVLTPNGRTIHYVMPKEVAQLLENHLSSGLEAAALRHGGKLGAVGYRAFRGAGNQMSQMLLGWNLFHATEMVLYAQFDAANNAIQAALHGQWGLAKGQLPGALIPGYGAVRALVKARAMEKEWLSPGSGTPEARLVTGWLEIAGGRNRGGSEYMGGAIESFQKSVAMIRHSPDLWGKAKNIPGLAYALPALNTLVSKPIMDFLVPSVKRVVFADRAKIAMAKLGPNPSIYQVREALMPIWDQMDKQHGLYTYDNLFYNRVIRDLFQNFFLSFGWNLGTVQLAKGAFRAVVDPAKWKALFSGKDVDMNIGFLLALMGGTAIYSALYQLIATGKGPEEFKDLYAPKTGKERADGVADRVMFPTYMRDVATLLNRADEPMRIPQNLYEMAKHKRHPALTLAADLFDNKDWQGKAIVNPNDPISTQAKDAGMRVFDAFLPISVHQSMRKDLDPAQKAQAFFGITPASSNVVHTNEEQRARELRNRNSPVAKKVRSRNNGVLPAPSLR